MQLPTPNSKPNPSTMVSTRQRQPSETAAPEGEDEEDDIGTLIYKESQLRKKEAAAAAAAVKKSKKNSSTTSTAAIRDGDSSPTASLETKSTKRKRRSSADDDEGKEVEKRAARKRYRYKCKADGCTNHAQKGGACVRHGAKVKRCSIDGCTNQDKRRGVCTRHGANRNPYDESTVFSFDRSSFDDTTAPLPNNRAAAAIINQEGSRDPPSVIVCQVIDHVEV